MSWACSGPHPPTLRAIGQQQLVNLLQFGVWRLSIGLLFSCLFILVADRNLMELSCLLFEKGPLWHLHCTVGLGRSGFLLVY